MLDEDHPAAPAPVQGHFDAVGVILAGGHADHAGTDAGLLVAEGKGDGRLLQRLRADGKDEGQRLVLGEAERERRRGRIAQKPQGEGIVPAVPVEQEHEGQLKGLPEAEALDAGEGQAEEDVAGQPLDGVFRRAGRGGAPDAGQLDGGPAFGPAPFEKA